MANKIKKVHCHSCGFEQVTDDLGLSQYEYNSLDEKLCEECNSAVEISEDLTSEEIIEYIENKLDYSDFSINSIIELPQKLLDEIKDEFVFDEEKTIRLAHILNDILQEIY